MTCTASDVGGQPGAAAIPAEITETPCSSNASALHFKHFAKLWLHQQFGHRTAARVAGANEQYHHAGQPSQCGFADHPLAQHFQVIVFNSHDRRWLPVAAGAVVEHHRDIAVERLHDFLSGHGGRRCRCGSRS